MKKNKKQKTYADVAKEIRAKYTRADWDKIERRDMMKELSALRDEQEEYRAIIGVDQVSQEENDINKHGYAGDQYIEGTGNIGGMNQHLADMNSLKLPNSLVNASQNNLNTLSQKFQMPQTSILPYAISAGASAIGDIVGLRNINKNMPKSVNLPRITPTTINLQPQREAIQRGYNTATNIALRNSRDISSPANAYANQMAGLSTLTDSYGTQMGQSYMNEASTNAQFANHASQTNAEIGTREALTNAQLKQNRVGAQNQYINSLSETIPMALRDYRQQSNETNMINTMGKEFGVYQKYNPNMTFMEKLKMGILGPQYDILNRNYANKNLVNG